MRSNAASISSFDAEVHGSKRSSSSSRSNGSGNDCNLWNDCGVFGGTSRRQAFADLNFPLAWCFANHAIDALNG